MYRFMVVYIGDLNPMLDRWANKVAVENQGKRLGHSYCLFSGTRNIQFSFECEHKAREVKALFDRADLSVMGENYSLETTEVTSKGWAYPPPVKPIKPPHRNCQNS